MIVENILNLLYIFKDLAVGFLMLIVLTTLVFLIIRDWAKQDRNVVKIFLFVLVLHLCAVMFVHYADFRPFSGGADYEGYNNTAIEIANRLKQGNFSLSGIPLINYFPVLIGAVYTFTIPTMLIGQMFMVWLAALSSIILYSITLEIGGSKKGGFWTCIIASLLPSYLLFGSLLLKDNVVILLVLVGILLSIKIFKNLSLFKFLLFFILTSILIHFRFYIGFALMFSFIICWFVISSLRIKKRIIFGLIMAMILGFSPQLVGNGFYGYNLFENFLNINKITNFREVVYNPSNAPKPTESVAEPVIEPVIEPIAEPVVEPGTTSSFLIPVAANNPFSFAGNYFQSFLYSLLGPFPWQITQKKHLLFLVETIPFYFLLPLMIYKAYKIIKEEGVEEFLKVYRFLLPILVFSIFAIGALSLYINNFGIIARIRMPVYILLLCFLSIACYFSIFKKSFNK